MSDVTDELMNLYPWTNQSVFILTKLDVLKEIMTLRKENEELKAQLGTKATSMKYIKKPIPVDAWQIDLDNDKPDWVDDAVKTNKVNIYLGPDKVTKVPYHAVIKTLEGNMTAYPGDYLIKGPEGEYWFNKKEIFEKTYEAVNA